MLILTTAYPPSHEKKRLQYLHIFQLYIVHINGSIGIAVNREHNVLFVIFLSALDVTVGHISVSLALLLLLASAPVFLVTLVAPATVQSPTQGERRRARGAQSDRWALVAQREKEEVRVSERRMLFIKKANQKNVEQKEMENKTKKKKTFSAANGALKHML